MIVGSSIKDLFLTTIAILITQCGGEQRHEARISYPQPLPDSVAVPFLPGIVSCDSLDFNAAFSPDGKCFYFSRSSKGKWMIYVTKLSGGLWSKPVLAS